MVEYRDGVVEDSKFLRDLDFDLYRHHHHHRLKFLKVFLFIKRVFCFQESWHRRAGRRKRRKLNAKHQKEEPSVQTIAASLEVQLPITSAPNATEILS